MGKHISDRLYSCCHVMSSDDDQSIVMDIYVGFTSRDELAVSLELYDYERPRRDSSIAAIVNTDDARRMAKRHKVKYKDLPLFIAECMAEWCEIINPDFHQLSDCFKEITECLLDEDCRFRIDRTSKRLNFI